jgi:hypothetical protein
VSAVLVNWGNSALALLLYVVECYSAEKVLAVVSVYVEGRTMVYGSW